MLRTSQEPELIEGGTLTKISEDLYLIKALSPEILIEIGSDK